MTDALSCDWCKRTSTTPRQWFVLEHVEGFYPVMDSWPKHFCDPLCLEAFAHSKQDPETAVATS